MTEYLLILVSTILVNNFVLVQFLGLCPFMGVSGKLETAMGMSLATTFVLTLSSVCSYLVYTYLLAPLDLAFLKTITFILVIAVVVQFTEMVVRKTSPLLYRVLGIFLPLITTNCAVLGVALLNLNKNNNFVESVLYGFGAARRHWYDYRRSHVAGVSGLYRPGYGLTEQLFYVDKLSDCRCGSAGTGAGLWRVAGVCRRAVQG